MSALTIRQRQGLAILARRAWEQCPEADGLDADSWRHEEVSAAVGKRGLRCCSQLDYAALRGHFLEKMGEHGAAFAAQVRAATEGRRQVLWKIRRRCEEYGVKMDVAEGICRRMTRGKALAEIEDESILWNVFFKLRHYEPNSVVQPNSADKDQLTER